MTTEILNGAQALIRSLEMAGVEVIFGLPGGAILPAYDPIIESPIRHVLVRHEQGAGHMAEGYAHVTGKPGVLMVTSGPGATNIVTPLANAMMDSVPLVAITGQVATSSIGSDAFQECDTTGVTMSVTKHNYLVTDAQEIPRIIAEAFHLASTGRPGPVLVDIPKDVANNEMEWYWPGDDPDLPGYKPTIKGHPRQIKEAARLIFEADRPVIYAGGGILKARAVEALRELVDVTNIHVVTTLMGRGVFPDSDERCLAMPGMHGNYTAVTALQKCDLLIALGVRFDDRVTGNPDFFAPDATVIHVDIDPAELGKVRIPQVPIVGDCRLVIEDMTKMLRRRGPTQVDRAPWNELVASWKKEFPLRYEAAESDGPLKPQYVVEKLRDHSPDDSIVVAGVGLHQMWASQYWKFDYPYTWVNSGGLGTMGFAVPAAIGAKVGEPSRTVWAIDGDGCFQMTAQELITARAENIPVKIAILNNANLGMVRQWQELFYGERYSEVYLSADHPNYVMWAEAMGCVGIKVTTEDEVLPAIKLANSIDDRPVVIDFRVDPGEKVYPMVPAGGSNDNILLGPEDGDPAAFGGAAPS